MAIIKKIFIISTVFLLVLVVFFGIYIFAFKKDDVEKIKTVDEENNFELVDLVSEKMVNITSDSVLAAAIGPGGETIRYYDGVSGRAWTMTLRGTNREVLDSEVMGVPKNVTWSNDGVSAILTYENGDIYIYNHATKSNHKLRPGMDSVTWAGISGKILYKYYDDSAKERSLNIANADGSNWKKLADIPYRYVDFTQIPSSILAAFWPQRDRDVQSVLHTVSTINIDDVKEVFGDRIGADYLFSPNGKKALVSSVSMDGKNVTLGVINANGTEYTDLLVPTIVDKVVWSYDSESIYYALPNNVPENVVWPNDYDAGLFTTQDTFFKSDISTGKKTRIIELEEITESVDARQLFLSPSEDALYFINKKNNLLYRLNL
jgi:hypothetical protein